MIAVAFATCFNPGYTQKEMKKMGLPRYQSDEVFCYADYCDWPEDERWELIDGVAYDMCAAPSRRHQDFSAYLYLVFGNYLKGKTCRYYPAPFDVILTEEGMSSIDEARTVVQPDLSVICDPDKLIDQGCHGAPDLIVEILSPSTSKKDMDEKFHLYERFGVREYWIIDPAAEYIRQFTLQKDGRYDKGVLIHPAAFGAKRIIVESLVLPGFTVNAKELFESQA
jgi:Uma2 family endonuclease